MDMKQRKQMKPRRDIVEVAERGAAVCRRWSAGETRASIAASFGVSVTRIAQIRNRTLRHLRHQQFAGMSEEEALQAMVDAARERYRAHYGEG